MPKGFGNPDQFVLYDGSIVLHFNEAEHVYTLDGKVVPSTTQITKAGIAKEFLYQWAASSTAKYVSKQWRPGKTYTEDAIENILKRGKFHYKNVQNRATDIGTNAHEWIESFVEYVMDTGDRMPNLDIFELPHSLEAINSVAAFLTWYNTNDVTFIHSEKKVYSVAHHYSGTFDLLALVNGVLTMVDFKTSKDVYEDYFIQGAAYVVAYHEELEYLHALDGIDIPDDEIVKQFMVLQIPKNGDNYKTGTIQLDAIMPFFAVFEACRVIYDWTIKPSDNPWGDGSMVKPEIIKGTGKPGIYFPDYQ